MKIENISRGLIILLAALGFILAFTYMSLNIKTVDYGYELQELATRKERLKEEIDKLKSRKAQLLNLERVEKRVIEELGYQYPTPEQIIKVPGGDRDRSRH